MAPPGASWPSTSPRSAPACSALPAGRFDAVLRIERRVSHEGMVSVGGNLYSVPDGTRKRVLEVETTADCRCASTRTSA